MHCHHGGSALVLVLVHCWEAYNRWRRKKYSGSGLVVNFDLGKLAESEYGNAALLPFSRSAHDVSVPVRYFVWV